jgi:hypothetical protein
MNSKFCETRYTDRIHSWFTRLGTCSTILYYYSCRELLESMQAGTLEPEVAFLNASLVLLFFLIFLFYLIYLSIYSTTGSQLFLNAPDSRYFPSSSSCTQDTCAQVPRLFDHTYSSFRARLQLLRVQTCKIMSCYLFNLLCYYGSHFQLQLLISVCLVTRLLSL